MTLAACTVVTRNHLAFARITGRSWLDHHRGSTFTIVVVDHDGMPEPSWIHRDIRLVGPDALGVTEDELRTYASIYGAAELACVLKPAALIRLLDDTDAAVYLDADIEVLDSMDELEDLAVAHGVVLSPHTLHPMPEDGALPDHFTMLQAGMFNGGLVAVGRDGIPFLTWWADRLRRDGIHEPSVGMHGDQRWLDQVPTWFPHHILRDPTYNVAYWNLHERPTTWDGETVRVFDRRIRCFHYSGLMDAWPARLSRFLGDEPRIELRDHPAVARLCRNYIEQCRSAGLAADQAIPYRFAAADADGTPVDRRARRLWRNALLAHEAGDAAELPPSPFAADGGRAWVAWLRTGPIDHVGRYLQLLWDESPDLQRSFPDLTDPVHRARFCTWVVHHSAENPDIPPTLLPDHEDTLMDDEIDADERTRRPRLPDVRSQQPVPELDAARHALEQPAEETAKSWTVRRIVGKAMQGRDERADEVTRNLMAVVAELTARIAELGERINQLNDDIPEQADRIDTIRDEATVLAYEQQGLTERIDQIDLTVEEERERLDGALEQDIITSSILADAEARLTAEVADLQLRLDKLDDEPPRRDDEDD
ncbi:MAG: hypothetical protein JO291_12620 [Acidimicrobiia bacterium]|nr:hypothetical protein [Acidimicrobiia bacterium]